jgi:hypothetical protein
MATSYLGLGMRMSFGDIMCNRCDLFIFSYGTLFLSRGEKGF